MIRDFIMDEKYFADYIYEEEERIIKFKRKLEANEVREDRVFHVERKIDSLQFRIWVAKYSAGYAIDILKKEFTPLVNNMSLFWDDNSNYIDMLWMMSIAIMLDIDKESFSILTDLVNKYNRNDSLLDLFGGYKYNYTYKVRNEKETIAPYTILTEAIRNQNIDENILIDYVKNKWYCAHKNMGWYDVHKAKEKLYYGYWSFEAGAVAKIFNIDDSRLKDEPYYPYDLVHFR